MWFLQCCLSGGQKWHLGKEWNWVVVHHPEAVFQARTFQMQFDGPLLTCWCLVDVLHSSAPSSAEDSFDYFDRFGPWQLGTFGCILVCVSSNPVVDIPESSTWLLCIWWCMFSRWPWHHCNENKFQWCQLAWWWCVPPNGSNVYNIKGNTHYSRFQDWLITSVEFLDCLTLDTQ